MGYGAQPSQDLLPPQYPQQQQSLSKAFNQHQLNTVHVPLKDQQCRSCGHDPVAARKEALRREEELKKEFPVPNRLTKVWNRANEYLNKRQFEDAYRLILTEGDDMYLLRLMVQTRPVMRFLDAKTAKKVLARLNKIVRGGVFERLEIDWIEDSKSAGHFIKLNETEMNEYLDTLYCLSRQKHNESVASHASEVYEVVKMAVLRKQKQQKAAEVVDPRYAMIQHVQTRR